MTKAKKLLYVLLSVIMLIAACCFVGCDKTDDGETKYDVTAKVVATRGGTQIGEWIFTPDVKEQYVEYDYTGEEIIVRVDKAKTDASPWNGKWFTPGGNMKIAFRSDMLYSDTNGKQDLSITKVIERGTYCYNFDLECNYNFIKFRYFFLYIKIV